MVIYDPKSDPRQRTQKLPAVGGAAAPQQPAPIQYKPQPVTTMGAGGVGGMTSRARPTVTPISSAGSGTTAIRPMQGGIVTRTQPTAPPQPAPVAPSPPLFPSIAGASVTPINPGADLRSTQITPSPSQRLATAQGQTAAAAGNVAGFDTRDSIRGFRDEFAGPDTRSQIAKDRLAAFDLENMQGVKDLQRQVIQRAASAGRLGMGDETVNQLRPFTDFLTQREAFKHRLAADTAEGEIGDRFGALDRAIGVTGLDRSGDLASLGALSGYERDIGDFEEGGRDELRGERDFQTMLSRQAMEDAIRQRMMENSEYGDEWARNFALTNLGLGGNSANVLLSGAGQAGQSGAAATGAAGDLFAQWLARRRQEEGGN